MRKTELKDIDPDDIQDMLIQIEQSFGLKFPNDAFRNMMTFDDLISVIEHHVTLEHSDSCTLQQAFYRIRDSFNKLNLDKEIYPDLELSTVFPRLNRRAIVKEFTEQLGIEVDLLKPHSFVLSTNLAILLMGVVLLFPYPLIGLVVTGLSIFSLRWVFKFGKEFKVKNIRELSELLMNEKYSLIRSSNTVNRNEIRKVVSSYFESYGLTEKLTSNSRFV